MSRNKELGAVGIAALAALNTRYGEAAEFARVTNSAGHPAPWSDNERWLRRLVSHALYSLTFGCEKLAKFADDFSVSPSDRFDWADSPMEAAAEIEIYAYLMLQYKLAVNGKGKTDLEVYDYLLEDAMRNMVRFASDTGNSTSRSSNAMKDYRCAVWANVYSKLTGGL